MNEKVREGVKSRMRAEKMTHQDLADLTGIERPNITRMLTGTVGKVPKTWEAVLDALDLELVVKPKKRDEP